MAIPHSIPDLAEAAYPLCDTRTDGIVQTTIADNQPQAPIHSSSATGLWFMDAGVSLVRFIVFMMMRVPAVEEVHARHDRGAGLLLAWIVVPDRDEGVLEEIYTQEETIIDRFPDLDFDFYVLYRGQHAPSEMISEGVDLVFRRN